MIEAELRMAEGPERDEIFAMIQSIYEDTLKLRMDGDEHDINKAAKLIAALMMFAGSITGEFIACGLLSEEQIGEATASAAKNYVNGIQAGINKAQRLAAKQQSATVN